MSPAKIARVHGQAKPSMWFDLVSGSGAETVGNEDDDLEIYGDFGAVVEIVGAGEEGEDDDRRGGRPCDALSDSATPVPRLGR